MINKLMTGWSIVLLFVIIVTAGHFLLMQSTGRDMNGIPASISKMVCADISKEFIGAELELDYELVRVERIDALEERNRMDDQLRCTGLAFLDGKPSTLVFLSAETGTDGYDLLIGGAEVADFDCSSLAQEVVRRFSEQDFGAVGRMASMDDPMPSDVSSRALTCQGIGRFGAAHRQRVMFAYDGTNFTVDPA